MIFKKRKQRAQDVADESTKSLADATAAKETQQALRKREKETVTTRLNRLAEESGNHLAIEFLQAFTERHWHGDGGNT